MTTIQIIRTILGNLPSSEKLVWVLVLTAFPALMVIVAAITP